MTNKEMCFKDTEVKCNCLSCIYGAEKLQCDQALHDMCNECFANCEEFKSAMCDRCVDVYRNWMASW